MEVGPKDFHLAWFGKGGGGGGMAGLWEWTTACV